MGNFFSLGPHQLFNQDGMLLWILANPDSMPFSKSLVSVIAEISKEKAKFWELCWPRATPNISYGCDFVMGRVQFHLHAKFEVAGLIYYGNMWEFVSTKFGQIRIGNTLFFGETDFSIGFADIMFSIQHTTVVEV